MHGAHVFGRALGEQIARDVDITLCETSATEMAFDTKRHTDRVATHDDCVALARRMGEQVVNTLW